MCGFAAILADFISFVCVSDQTKDELPRADLKEDDGSVFQSMFAE